MAIARTGSPATNGSGDYAVAFSTAETVRRTRERRNSVSDIADLPNNQVSPLFEASMEASEEAIYNALVAGDTTEGFNGTIEALPLGKLIEIIQKSGR
jgi:D-aminopeptidase